MPAAGAERSWWTGSEAARNALVAAGAGSGLHSVCGSGRHSSLLLLLLRLLSPCLDFCGPPLERVEVGVEHVGVAQVEM